MSEALWVWIARNVLVKQGNTQSHKLDSQSGISFTCPHLPPPLRLTFTWAFSSAANADEFSDPHSDSYSPKKAKEHSCSSKSLGFPSTYGYCWARDCEGSRSPKALLSSFPSLLPWKETSMVNLHGKRKAETQRHQ